MYVTATIFAPIAENQPASRCRIDYANNIFAIRRDINPHHTPQTLAHVRRLVIFIDPIILQFKNKLFWILVSNTLRSNHSADKNITF